MEPFGLRPAEGMSAPDLSPTDLAREAFLLADRLAFRSKERATAQGLQVQCRKGCGVCCRYLVRLSIPEALFLAERLEAMPPARREALLGRLRRTHEVLRREWLYGVLEDGLMVAHVDVTYPHRFYLLSRHYLGLRIPCPFLEEEACSIYADRPTTCRQYLVTSPPGRCADPFAQKVDRVNPDLDVPDLLAEVTAELLGEPPKLVALPLALGWASRNRRLAGCGSATTRL
jgi:Fe-S-cluster containining protein